MIDFDQLVLGATAQVFGQPAIYTPAAGVPKALTAIFDHRYKRLKVDDRGVEVVVTCPMLGCRASDFPGRLPTRDELIQVDGQLYRIAEVDVDGFGGVSLQLKTPPGSAS